MDLNKSQIIGRVTQDIELKSTPNGQSVCSLSMATNRSWTDSAGNKQENAEFHNIVLWGKLAEIAAQYVTKGQKLYIEGRLQTRNWEAQDGTKRYRTEIVGENMIMLGGGNKDEFEESDKKHGVNAAGAAHQKAKAKQEEISVEDIPF